MRVTRAQLRRFASVKAIVSNVLFDSASAKESMLAYLFRFDLNSSSKATWYLVTKDLAVGMELGTAFSTALEQVLHILIQRRVGV